MIRAVGRPISLVIEATIDIDPDVLNLRSHGRWVTCYIELPEGYDPADIDVATVQLVYEGNAIPAESWPTTVGDYDGDGIPDRMVKVDRQELVALLRRLVDPPADVELVATGELYDGTAFEGSDIIRVIDAGGGPQLAGADGKSPGVFLLCQNQPNPFGQVTAIQYEVPSPAYITLRVYDIRGRLVATLADGDRRAGSHTVVWDGKDSSGKGVASGVYFCRLVAGDFTATKKMLVVR